MNYESEVLTLEDENVSSQQSNNMLDSLNNIEVIDKFPKKKNKIILVIVIVIILCVGGVLGYFAYKKDFFGLKDKNVTDSSRVEKEPELVSEKKYKNKIEEKNVIESSLDYKAIFSNDNWLGFLSLYNEVTFSNDRIYYSYAPNIDNDYCYDIEANIAACEAEQKIMCSVENAEKTVDHYELTCAENMCRNLTDLMCWGSIPSTGFLAEKYKEEIEGSTYVKRHLISSNYDGTDFKEHKTGPSGDVFIFEHVSKDAVYVNMSGDVSKIDVDGNLTSLGKDIQVVDAFSDDDTLVVLEHKKDDLYNMVYYDAKTMKEKKKQEIVLGDKLFIRIDPYSNDLYNIYNRKALYKNGKKIYSSDENISFYDIFISSKNIYIIAFKSGKDSLIVLDKKDYKVLDTVDVNLDNNLNYLLTYDGKAYFYTGAGVSDSSGIYVFDEEDMEFRIVLPLSYEISNYGKYHNFVYYYEDFDSINKTFTLYNLATEEETVIKNVVYNTFNEAEGRLYVVQFIDDKYELSYYEID